jgi:hypothetical protein
MVPGCFYGKLQILYYMFYIVTLFLDSIVRYPEHPRKAAFFAISTGPREINPMRSFYLVFAIVGAIIPLAFFTQFFFGGGSDAVLLDFAPALFVNSAAGGFAADLLISSFVFWGYMWNRRASGPKMLPFVALNLCIGLSCALPAYLYAATTNDGDDS